MLSRFTGPFYINLSLHRIINLEKNVNLITHTWINSNTVPKINTMKSGMNFIQYMCQETRLYYSPHWALAPSFTLKNTFEGSITEDNLQVCGNTELSCQLTKKALRNVTLDKKCILVFCRLNPVQCHEARVRTQLGIQVGEEILYSYQVSNMAHQDFVYW